MRYLLGRTCAVCMPLVSIAVITTPMPSGASLTVVSRNATGPVYAVARANDITYAGFGGRFCVVNEDFAVASYVDLPSVIDGIRVQGNTAYVTTWHGGLCTIHLGGVDGPELVATLPLSGQGRGLAIAGSVAYVASSDAGIRVVDISQVANPIEIGFFDTGGTAYDVAALADYAFVADRTGGVSILNVSIPAMPQLVSSYTLGTSQRAYDVDLQGSSLLVAYGNAGLHIVDVTNPSAPTALGSLAVGGEAFGVTAVGGLAYVTLLGGGLAIVDVSSPTTPSLLGSMSTSGSSYEAVVDAQKLYLADGDEALRLIDIDTPSSPVEISYLDAVGVSADLAVTENSILVANFAESTNGFRVLDALNPLVLDEISRFATVGPTPRLAVQAKYVYLTEQWPNYGLTIASMQNPISPEQVSHLNFGGPPSRIDVLSDHAYLTRDQTMSIVNVQNPQAPTLVGTFVAGSAFDALLSGVTVSGTRAYLTDYLLGLRIVSVANPASPVQLGTYPSAETAYDVAVAGNIAYLAMSDALRVIDVSAPSSPTLLSTLPIPESYAVVLNGNTAYLCANHAGVIAIDVSNPAAPVISGQYDTGDRAIAACLYYDYVVVADANNGIYVLADDTIVSTPPVTVRSPKISAYPNPFNPSATISFTVAGNDHVVLQVFDVRGVLVRTLANRLFAVGVQAVSWDGTDDDGRPVASGVYFCQLRSGATRASTKLVLTK